MNPFLLTREQWRDGQLVTWATSKDMLFCSLSWRSRRLYGLALDRIQRRAEPPDLSGPLFLAFVALLGVAFAMGILFVTLF